MNNKNILSIISFALFLLVFYLYESFKMYIVKDGSFVDSSTNTLVILALIAGTFAYCIYSQTKVVQSNLVHTFTIQMLEIYLITIVFALFTPLIARIQYFEIILPLLLFFFSYKVTTNIDNIPLFLTGISILTLALAFYFLWNYQNNALYDVEKANLASYTVLMFLPFLLCFKNNIVRIVSIIFVFIIILLSLKRGGFFAMILGLMVYYWVMRYIKTDKSNNYFALLFFLIVCAGFYFLFARFDETSEGLMLARLEEMSETGGSGRLAIYQDKWQEIVNSNPLSLIFGHGWCATARAGKTIGLTAHNDILEIIYDFGLVGLVLFVCVLVSIYKLFKELVDDKSRLAAPMGASMGILLVLICVSHIWIYSQFLSIFALFWGFVLAAKDNDYFEIETDWDEEEEDNEKEGLQI